MAGLALGRRFCPRRRCCHLNTNATIHQTHRQGVADTNITCIAQHGTTLAEVHADHVIVNRSGARERIDLDRYDNRGGKAAVATSAPVTFRLNVASNGTNAYSRSRQELNSVLQDPRQQVFFNGRLSAAVNGGVRIDDVPKGSLLDKIGLKAGDTITGINGQPVNSQGDLEDIDFTPDGISTRIEAGIAEGRRVLAAAPWQLPVNPMAGVIVHEKPSEHIRVSIR